MLFNSEVFILLFLPLTLGVYYALARHEGPRLWALAVASLIFYGYWDIRFLPILIGSTVGNWLIALIFARLRRYSWIPLAGVAFNVGVIALFKYADFITGTLAAFGVWNYAPTGIILPLGISFFTFQHISYQMDMRRAAARGEPFPAHNLRDYLLFVAFFPHLISGPIVRHNEIIGQFHFDPLRPGLAERLSRGAVMFIVGLTKKVLIADSAARMATPLYKRALAGGVLNLGEAWLSVHAYMLQLYFDFSGYSDMAIGMALMFGFAIPFNFDRPHMATAIQDFWRRWHMTLSRFLRDYVYIPLGGNQGGVWRQARNMFLTMLVGGLWHGANWTYVVWGAMHGVGVAANILWRRAGFSMPSLLGWACMTLFIGATWVLFRTESFTATWSIYQSLVGWHGMGGAVIGSTENYLVLGVGTIAALCGPSSQSAILERLRPWRGVGLAAGAVAVFLVLLIGGGLQSEFIYFQF
ncbi:MAG: MBOAT family O-acyltransferase [Pseudomonadota bacterium]|jgi:alginate O-acetyltransferase complex protein AlgI|nr:acyltransferase [Alphaproteobacteria bacterium]